MQMLMDKNLVLPKFDFKGAYYLIVQPCGFFVYNFYFSVKFPVLCFRIYVALLFFFFVIYTLLKLSHTLSSYSNSNNNVAAMQADEFTISSSSPLIDSHLEIPFEVQRYLLYLLANSYTPKPFKMTARFVKTEKWNSRNCLSVMHGCYEQNPCER